MGQLAEMHLDPTVSDPKRIEEIPDDAISEGETRPRWEESDLSHDSSYWDGVWKDVGIFTDRHWALLMSKCLSSMGKDCPMRCFVELTLYQRYRWLTLDH